MEARFRKRASEQRRRLETLLREESEPGELERKVTEEMEDFLSESTLTAERMLEDIDQGGEMPPADREELRANIENFFAGVIDSATEPLRRRDAPDEPPGEDESEVLRERLGGPAKPKPRPKRPMAEPAPAETPPKPSVTERRALGGKSTPPGQPLDLKAALDRIQQHTKDAPIPEPGKPPPETGEPSPAPGGAYSGSREEILDSFDRTFDQVSGILEEDAEAQRGGEGGPPPVLEPAALEPSPVVPSWSDEAPPAEEPPETEAAPDEPSTPEEAAARYREMIRKSGAKLGQEHEPGPRPEPPPEAEGSLPAGVRNVFEAEPGEDRDIDDDVDTDSPPGWDIPTRPPPPGAWVVEKQKEEGGAALAGMAGDTYLMRKMNQEVRLLNKLYLLLLKKGVVTREEVEGSGAAPSEKAKKPPVQDDDDDEFSVDDVDDDRFRPILTDDKDFSLSGLVQDIHRLKCLRDVLLKKGVVSEKELKKAEKSRD
ncbi:MAG: hypothetical protein ACYTDY_08615 [Planctomycetota bacterium]|jgi:hypothetical protein